jgi:hypothetical protein
LASTRTVVLNWRLGWQGRRQPPGHGRALSAEMAGVRVRWVPDALWPLLVAADGHRAPRAAGLVDLLESDDPRARREAARALSE